MANRVTLSTLGPAPKALDPSDFERGVEEMILHWDRQFENVLPCEPDLIVLPEACDRAPNFTPEQRVAYYKVRGNRVRDHFMEVARREGVNIAYSAARIMPDGTWRNSTQFINRKGGIDGIYNKNHLVVTEYSNYNILYGKDAPIIQTDFGRVGGVICFDLNFDELRLKYKETKPDLLVFSSMYHGGLMQNYWAYSCRSYFIGAVPNLPCAIISPLGNIVAQSTQYYPYISATVNLDYAVAHLDFNRQTKFKALKDKYRTGVTLFEPGLLGPMLITSEIEGISAMDMVREFEIELWDDYYARSMADRHAPGHMEP